jgi:hypothetical protein
MLKKHKRKKPQRRIFMKKGKILAVGLIVLLLAGVLVLASCVRKCPDGGDCVVRFSGNSILYKETCSDENCFVAGIKGGTNNPSDIKCSGCGWQ